ncbi:hypothetical protein [Arenicella xantha]|uniref:Uncharacterized protein n=1 Tax=Arenicella xantha TaxID=644221 RepID=A0A395JHH7_9GAMM|nr:hypothetical protein [Arenicella xantha]RBP49123.1 hypothetical protein DFR28_10449 [Arenicella xantha]
MKVTDELTDLVVELGELESFELAGMLINQNGVSVKGLLQLFNQTDNLRSKQVVREIFDEMGYGWFVELDEMTFRSAAGLKKIKTKQTSGCDTHIVARAISEDEILSDQEFLELIPINQYFH